MRFHSGLWFLLLVSGFLTPINFCSSLVYGYLMKVCLAQLKECRVLWRSSFFIRLFVIRAFFVVCGDVCNFVGPLDGEKQ